MKTKYYLLGASVIVSSTFTPIVDVAVQTKYYGQSNSATQVINEKKENLESKLNGLEFTEKDIKEYKKYQEKT